MEGKVKLIPRKDLIELCATLTGELSSLKVVQILPRTYSDHSPLLIRILGRSSIGRFNKPFRFETTWMMDSSFENLGHNSWTGDNIFDCIKNFTNEAIAWNENVFGNIFRKKGGFSLVWEVSRNHKRPIILTIYRCFKKNLLMNTIIFYVNRRSCGIRNLEQNGSCQGRETLNIFISLYHSLKEIFC